MRRNGIGLAGIPTFARCASVGKRHMFAVAVTAWAVVGFFSITGHAGQARQVTAAGSYSAAQANRGKTLYSDQCVACHGEMLEGVVGPPLTGADFLTDFGGHPVTDLIQKIQSTMPQQAPGTLTHAQATDLTAYILQFSKYPAGPDLTDASATQFTLPGSGAAAAPAAAAVNTTGLPTVTASANLAQFMRAVTFPNANIIFNTQLYDPGKEKPKMPIPYDYVLWGKTVYYGWEAVDEAILALRDTSPMLLLPGRRCQNGRPVPMQNADYQQAVKDLVAFTDELWKAAQTRNQETVSDLSEKLNDTCANCHKVYRDVSVSGGASTGSLTADRCNANPKGGGVAQ
jgi:mono/diheme cytochrome c family protein